MGFDQLGAVTIALCPARAAFFTKTPGESTSGFVAFGHRLAAVFAEFIFLRTLSQSLKPPSMLGRRNYTNPRS